MVLRQFLMLSLTLVSLEGCFVTDNVSWKLFERCGCIHFWYNSEEEFVNRPQKCDKYLLAVKQLLISKNSQPIKLVCWQTTCVHVWVCALLHVLMFGSAQKKNKSLLGNIIQTVYKTYIYNIYCSILIISPPHTHTRMCSSMANFNILLLQQDTMCLAALKTMA